MSLRDELQSWLDEVTFRSVWPIIERALAAERAATIEECHAAIEARFTRREPFATAWLTQKTHACLALDELPHDRSALDAMLAEARAEGELAMFDQFWDLAACCYGAPTGKHSPASLLDALVDQARAEQREKDAVKIDNLKRAIEEGRVGRNLEAPIQTAAILSEVAAVIRAPKD